MSQGEPDKATVDALRKADNLVLREHRKVARDVVALLKSFDKDLQTLSSYNTHDENFTMNFNDSELDEVQRMGAAREAVVAWVEVAKLVNQSSLLTASKTDG